LNAARPNLSRRFRAYYLDDIQNLFANPMLRNCWLTYNKEEQQAMLNKTETKLNPLQWMRSEVPLMCRDGFKINILYYIFALADLRSTRLTDPDVFLLRIYQEGKVQLTDEELQIIKDFHELRTNKNRDVSLNEAFQTKIIPILSKPLIAQYWDWELSEQNVAMQVNVLNSLDIDDDTREILKTQTILRDIDGKSHVASPRILELAHKEVHHPRLIQAIDNANQRIIDFLAENERQEVVEPKAGSPASLRVPEEELKDITDGKALFEFITAPFRGYVIYVDLWGTWCGPCRGQMEYVPALKKILEGKPVVYLYFCNNSPDEAWRIYIRQNHLDTDNAIHYNLPKTQESAIEQYLEVSGFPTYRLVDTSGRLVPGGAPWPSNPSAVVAAIEQLLSH
jgi:thiol-disulfide isomerase/thioredoxin